MKKKSETNAYLIKHQFEKQQMIKFDIHMHSLRPEPLFDMHLAPELGVVLSGKMARYTAGIRTELSRGGVWWAGMFEPHGRQALEENSRVAVFTVNTDFFFMNDIPGLDKRIWQTPFNVPAERRPIVVDDEFAVMIERLERILSSSNKPIVQAAQMQLTFLEIILYMNHIADFDIEEEPCTSDIWRLRPAFELIYKSLRQVDTEKAAKVCNLSSARFSQLFAKVTNLSFSKFLLRHRLNQVAHELKINNCSLDELAEKWGFANKSHLVHRFKEYYNVTPSVYRGLYS